MSIKVSVIVPVFNGGSDIEPLIDSLREQSLPADEFEAIFVDDGSTDGTELRLDALAAEQSNVKVIHIPNSGWPGKPRNVGIDAARGEFIQFVDSDDRLGPEALERLYAMATANDSDVVIGKVVSNFRGVAQELFRVDRPRCSIDDAPLVSNMTPHKFFRTAFLRREGIRFPEGRRRLEDQMFVLPAYLAAHNVSVLSSYPCYYYLQRSDHSNAASTQIEPNGYYGNVREVIAILTAGKPAGEARWRLMRRWYRNEILSRLSEPVTLGQTPQFRHTLFEVVRETERAIMFPEVVEGLGSMMRVRAGLLQAGREDDLYALAVRASSIEASATIEQASWRDGRLRVVLSAEFRYAGRDDPLLVLQRGGRSFLDPSLIAGFTDGPLDVTDEAPAIRFDAFVREPTSTIEWPLKASRSVEAVSLPGDERDGLRVTPRVLATAFIDPLTTAGGSPLVAGTWELGIRLAGFGLARTGRPSMTRDSRGSGLPALLGTPPLAVVAAFDEEGRLELDVDRHRRTLASAVDPRRIRVTADGRTVKATLGIGASNGPAVPVLAVLRTAEGDEELPAEAVRARGRVEVRIDAAKVSPSGGGAASLAVGLDGAGQPLIDLGSVTVGSARIVAPNVQREPWQGIVKTAIRGNLRGAYVAAPAPLQRVARQLRASARAVVRSIAPWRRRRRRR